MKKHGNNGHKGHNPAEHKQNSTSSLGRYMEKNAGAASHNGISDHNKERGTKKWSDRGWKHNENCTCEKCSA